MIKSFIFFDVAFLIIQKKAKKQHFGICCFIEIVLRFTSNLERVINSNRVVIVL